MIRAAARPLVVAVALVSSGSAIAACAKSTPPAEPVRSSPPPAPPAPEEAGGDDLESSQRAFVARCSKATRGSEDYCACAWDRAREIYGDDAVLGPGKPSDDDMAKIHVKVARACVAHVPPEAIRASFMKDCARREQDHEAYCSCAWNELLGRMTPNEVAVERAKRTERFQAAMSGAAHACQRFR